MAAVMALAVQLPYILKVKRTIFLNYSPDQGHQDAVTKIGQTGPVLDWIAVVSSKPQLSLHGDCTIRIQISAFL